MQSSSEILSFLVVVMGTVVGVGLLLVAVFVLCQDAKARKAVAKAFVATLTFVSFVFGAIAMYATMLALFCSNHLLSKGRKNARTIPT